MEIYTLADSNVEIVARFMSEIKPDWWDFDGARQQLRDVHLLANLVGGYRGENERKPRGWILCAEYEGYSYLSIENLGFNENGKFVMEQQLEPLLQRAEAYARERGLRNMKYIIGSADLSCHGKPITDFAEELKNLKSYDREHFDYFMQIGFQPTGFIPNCYGENYHGILMIKSLI